MIPLNTPGVPHADAIIEDYNAYLLDQTFREPQEEPVEYFEFGIWYAKLYEWRKS
jgi:hypothetical protein